MDQQQHETYRLDDTAIAGLLQLLQLSVMTGTDIIDHLRSLSLVVDSSVEQINEQRSLVMSPDFVRSTEKFTDDLLQRLEASEKDVNDCVGSILS